MARNPPPYSAVDQHPRPSAPLALRYHDLASQNTFRLLKLHAGRESSIVCSLHNYDLTSALRPSYTALSYTWDQDRSPRSILHFPDGSTLSVRQNLYRAFVSLRHMDDDRWLWVDAICIDQDNDHERNHQVRLMADIYGNANIVLVWLQSAGQSTHVSRAFRFIHAAVTHDNSEQSVRNYIRAHAYDTQRNWRSVQHLCELRYWTRKWIIQELIGARTVVLQSDKDKCSMEDLEAFCRQIRQAPRDYAAFSAEIASKVLESPAARLALQRAERQNEVQQPQMLWQLVERYAGNKCGQPCDHVYALYSLSGPHRRHLRIDYSSRPLERLVAVVRFALSHEGLPSTRVLSFAQLLVSLFQLNPAQLAVDRGASETLQVTVSTSLLGTADVLPESEETFAMRRKVEAIDPVPLYSVDTSRDVWLLSEDPDPEMQPEPVGRQDMTYFGIRDTPLRGLAACRLRTGDSVLHLPEARFVYILRREGGHGPQRACIIGRAEILSPVRRSGDRDAQPWHQSVPGNDGVGLGREERLVSMSLATLLDLSSFAQTPVMKTETKGPGGKMAASTGRVVSGVLLDVEAVWNKKGPDWRRRAFISGCGEWDTRGDRIITDLQTVFLIFVLMLTKLVIQAINHNRAVG